MPTNFLDLPECIIPDKEEENADPNGQSFIICLYAQQNIVPYQIFYLTFDVLRHF